MADVAFFVVYYDAASARSVDDVVAQLIEAARGERLVVTAPDGIIVEQFVVGRPDEGDAWKEG